MRLSNRDIILLIGVVVAVVISLTAFVYRDQLSAVRHDIVTPGKISWHATAHRLIELIGKHNSVEHSR